MGSATDAYNYFVGQGYSSVGASAVVGNLYGESGLNPNAVGDSGLARGLAQWHPNRQAQFPNFSGSSFNDQLGFVNSELKNKFPNLLKEINNTNNLHDATYAFMRRFEAPANDSSFGKRLGAAQNVINGLGGNLASATTAAGSTIKTGVGDAIVAGLNLFVPGSGDAVKGLDTVGGFGIFGGKSWVDQIKDWFSNGHFFQRLAIGILALLLIGGALYLLGNKVIKEG